MNPNLLKSSESFMEEPTRLKTEGTLGAEYVMFETGRDGQFHFRFCIDLLDARYWKEKFEKEGHTKICLFKEVPFE